MNLVLNFVFDWFEGDGWLRCIEIEFLFLSKIEMLSILLLSLNFKADFCIWVSASFQTLFKYNSFFMKAIDNWPQVNDHIAK